MINPKVVKEFLQRARDDHRWMKSLSHKQLDKELAKANFKPCSPIPLLKHQKVCILLGIMYRAFPFWLDMGTGKTRIALELIVYWYKEHELDVALVLAPSESALIGWEKQIKQWSVKLPFVTLLNSPSQDKRDALDEIERGIILATYPGLARALSQLAVVKGKRKRKKRKLEPNKKLIAKIASRIDCIVADESTKLGNHDSLIYRIVKQMRKSISIFYELAGRPFGRDPILLWSQLYLIDKGATLGDTLGLFRAAFYTEKINFWGGYEYTFKKALKQELRRIVQHRSISYRWNECIDLPPLVPVIEPVKLPDEATSYYEQFVKQIKRTRASLIERQNAFIRMRQVSSGYVGFTDDETGERAEISFADNPKLDRLIELIEQVPRGCKWVIFYEFTHSGRLIDKMLTDSGVPHVWLWGGTKDARKLQDSFDDDESIEGMLVNHKLGAYALNLQRANYLFFFESPVPVIDREQAERRVRRQGQTRTVFQFDLTCEGTVDTRILAFHREGADLMKAIMKSPESVL